MIVHSPRFPRLLALVVLAAGPSGDKGVYSGPLLPSYILVLSADLNPVFDPFPRCYIITISLPFLSPRVSYPPKSTMGSPHSDDGGERPVRKQLSKASIQSTPQDSAKETISSRKRSFEESRDTAEDHHEDGQGRKKRSREGTPNEPEQKQAGSKHESAGPQEVSNPVSSLSGTVPLGLEDQRPLDRAQEFHGFDQTNVLRHDESRLTSALDEREKLFEQLLKDVRRARLLRNLGLPRGKCKRCQASQRG